MVMASFPRGIAHRGRSIRRIYINRRDGLNYARPSVPDSGWEVYNPPKEDAQEPGVEAPTGHAASEPETTPSIPAGREPANKAEFYPAGAIVTHKGKQWRSTTGGNRAEPGTDNSGEETGGGSLAAQLCW